MCKATDGERRRTTLREAKAEMCALGVTLTKRDGEYRVNLERGTEATAYYTDDIEDAVRTGYLMASEATRGPSTREEYHAGRDNALAMVNLYGIAFAAKHVGYDCRSAVGLRLDSDAIAYVRGESDALLYLASSEERPTLAEVEAYGEGFMRGDVEASHWLDDAVRNHCFAAAGAERMSYGRNPTFVARLKGESDALLLAVSSPVMWYARETDCGDCNRGVKHVHGRTV